MCKETEGGRSKIFAEPKGSYFFEKDGLKYSCCHIGKEKDIIVLSKWAKNRVIRADVSLLTKTM